MKTDLKILIFLLSVSLLSCSKENAPGITPVGPVPRMSISFQNDVNDELLILDTLIYQTGVGNHYMVTDLQFFISRIRLHQKAGDWLEANPDADPHYVDTRIPGTEQWNLEVTAAVAECDSISFVFGMDVDDNISNRFPDPPERDMFWPEMLGGGYHHMKLNMKWKKEQSDELKPFMFHLGTGQMYSGVTSHPDSIIGYIPNHFVVTLPFGWTFVRNGENPAFLIIMNIEKWFDGVCSFDFADYPKGIMQNQEGMFTGVQNGKRAFGIGWPVWLHKPLD